MAEEVEDDGKQVVEFGDGFVEGLGVGGVAGNGGDEGLTECDVEGADSVDGRMGRRVATRGTGRVMGSAFGKPSACARRLRRDKPA